MLITRFVPGAIAAIAAAGAVSYASISPTSQLWGKTVAQVAPGKIALTFDDGPNGRTTEELLDILAAANVPATFFLIGDFARRQPSLARAIHAAGHTIGNHTETHPNLFWLSPAQVREELIRCQQSIEDAIGAPATLFRPPFGIRRPDTLTTARSLGLSPVLWNVTCYDWRVQSADHLLGHAQRQMRRNERGNHGSILLLHDGGHRGLNADRSHTLEATRRLVAQFDRARFVGV